VIANVDQPIQAATVSALIAAWRTGGAAIIVPSFRGRRGHPVLLAGRLLPELRAVREETLGLRAVRGAHASELLELPVDDPLVLLDLNTPAEYEASQQSRDAEPDLEADS
jgi:molybdenum cofactor cytidylyltransferase